MEILVVIAFLGYILYLIKFAGLCTPGEKNKAATLSDQDSKAKHADAGLQSLQADSSSPSVTKAPFFDKRLVINMMMVILTSALLVYVIKQSESIHLPYLVAVFSAISLGFVEPYKGWLLAITQCALMLAGYFLLTSLPDDRARQELENFSLYGSVILTFAASFLGGFLKRALNMK